MLTKRRAAQFALAIMTLALIGGCALRSDWDHPDYAPESVEYYQAREACMEKARTITTQMGAQHYDRDAFATCMRARGWFNP